MFQRMVNQRAWHSCRPSPLDVVTSGDEPHASCPPLAVIPAAACTVPQGFIFDCATNFTLMDDLPIGRGFNKEVWRAKVRKAPRDGRRLLSSSSAAALVSLPPPCFTACAAGAHMTALLSPFRPATLVPQQGQPHFPHPPPPFLQLLTGEEFILKRPARESRSARFVKKVAWEMNRAQALGKNNPRVQKIFGVCASRPVRCRGGAPLGRPASACLVCLRR